MGTQGLPGKATAPLPMLLALMLGSLKHPCPLPSHWVTVEGVCPQHPKSGGDGEGRRLGLRSPLSLTRPWPGRPGQGEETRPVLSRLGAALAHSWFGTSCVASAGGNGGFSEEEVATAGQECSEVSPGPLPSCLEGQARQPRAAQPPCPA